MLTDQQIDEFLEMLAKSPTSARDMVRGLFAANEAKAAPASTQDEPYGYFRAEPFGWTDCAATDEGAIALYERPAAPAVPNVLKRGYGRLIQAAADLALQQFMPSDIVDDYPSKTISAAKVAKMMTQPRDRLRLLSIEVSEGAKQMIAAALAAPSQPAVPQGWKLVPIEPTEEMLAAVSWPGCARTDWSHMLAAASSQESVNLSCRSTQARLAAQWGYVPAAPSQPVTLTEAERVRCLIKAGCIGTVKMTYDSGPYEITRTSINADRLIEAIIATLREKESQP